MPLEDFQKYLPHENDIEIYENNAYEDYDTSMTTADFRSTSEQLFEQYLEKRENVDWFFKNGNTGKQYLSIVYRTGFNKEYLFFPDYIIRRKNGDVWIVETKGGEVQGKSKNIDKQVENKFLAFKEYAEIEGINWGFVRDKNNRLYINNTEYSDDMSDSAWVKLNEIL